MASVRGESSSVISIGYIPNINHPPFTPCVKILIVRIHIHELTDYVPPNGKPPLTLIGLCKDGGRRDQVTGIGNRVARPHSAVANCQSTPPCSSLLAPR